MKETEGEERSEGIKSNSFLGNSKTLDHTGFMLTGTHRFHKGFGCTFIFS